MITISLCIIAKNEEDTLGRCLDSAKSVADEIIVVDTGSTDRTKEIASKFTDKVLDFQWIDDFSAARNFAFEQATQEYILWLDADDVILPEDAIKFKNLKESMATDVDAVMMKYNTGFDRQGNVTFSYFRERLSKRSRCFKWQEPVHEYLGITGNIINSGIAITHAKSPGKAGAEGSRNLEIYENFIAGGKSLSPRGMYYYARELKDNGRYSDAIRQFKLFLDSGQGWIEDNINACSELAKCYQAENNSEEALNSMLHSFKYDVPRAELCCQIGYYFKALSKYKQSAFWFELILGLKKNKDNWGFQQEDCWGYIPCIECAVCYDKLGDYKKAAQYNDRASEYKPDSPEVLHNKKYFDSKLLELSGS